MEIVRADEKAYLNELVAYRLQFEGYTYDLFNNKVVEVPVTVSQKFSFVWASTTAMSYQSEPVVTTIEEP